MSCARLAFVARVVLTAQYLPEGGLNLWKPGLACGGAHRWGHIKPGLESGPLLCLADSLAKGLARPADSLARVCFAAGQVGDGLLCPADSLARVCICWRTRWRRPPLSARTAWRGCLASMAGGQLEEMSKQGHSGRSPGC